MIKETEQSTPVEQTNETVDNISTDEPTTMVDHEEVANAVSTVNEELQQLQEQVSILTAESAANLDKAMRVSSELENYRKRAERDVAKAHKFAIEKFVNSLIPVIDSLEQAAVVDTNDTDSYKQGIDLTLKLLLDTFGKHNIITLDPVGEVFDPTLHEAMSMVPNTEHEAGTIMTVFQKGYQLEGRVIRPARVVVAGE